MEPLDYITLTPQETAKLLSAGSGDAALVYLYMKATGDWRLQKAQEQLHMPLQTLGWAESLLKQLGLMEVPTEAPRFSQDSAPTYTAEAVTAYAARDPSFALLQGEISRRLGRVLTSEELKTLLAIRDYLKMPPEVVTMVLTYCLQKNEYYNQTHGTNRIVTMRALEKECYAWANQGILTLERASDYISRNLQLLSPEGQVKKALQLDRPLSKSERQYIQSWLKMGFDPETIYMAYDRTMVHKGQLNWRYMNGILLKWHEKGLHRVQEIQTENENRKGTLKTQPNTNGYTSNGYTFGESDLHAIADLQKFRDSLKEE